MTSPRPSRLVAGALSLLAVPATVVLPACERPAEPVAAGAQYESEPPMPTSTPPADHDGREAAAGANRLAHETSPYLLQHAHNPVDWYPWGPEAFEAARAQDKPIFLSIGYSTCYWCHVMERESFENPTIAAYMNEHFISIKVDREERPDVDDIYMAATVIYNRGNGGWPMSVFLEPYRLEPFAAGTYFPPENDERLGRIGFRTLLEQIHLAWTTQRDSVLQQADRLGELVEQDLSQASWTVPLGEQQLDRAMSSLLGVYDRDNGGFGQGRNRFPMPVYTELLLGPGWRSQKVRDATLHTLDRMATGGMYDQVGGGFHRYSTDPQWLVPHFEKMLYDNAQLASAYAAAHEITGDPFYAEIVRETLDYVLREMTAAEGGYFSAQDAEVNTREGANYVWTPDEVRRTLEAAGLGDVVPLTMEIYGLDGGPNFQDPHHPEDGRRNVIFLKEKPSRLAAMMGYPPDWLDDRIRSVNEALLAARDLRDRPATDDKVLTGWNGLMIAGMADGGRVLGDPAYVDAARRAADFLLAEMRGEDGELLRVYREGRARVPALLVDYALLARGLLALHRATDESRWLEEAQRLVDEARDLFWDDRFGAFFDTRPGQSDLFVRTKTTYDGAVPSGNGAMANNLIDLYEITGVEDYLDLAVATVQGVSNSVAQNPVGSCLSVRAVARLAAGHAERLAAAAPNVPADAPGAVSIAASPERVLVGADRPATIEVRLSIAEGYHINAHEPGLAGLIGLEVRLADARGLALRGAYPVGELYQGQLRIHENEVVVGLQLQQRGEVVGEPRLEVIYQVCTDAMCLAPQTAVLPVEIRAGPPEAATRPGATPGGAPAPGG